jgi:uncharacterized protein
MPTPTPFTLIVKTSSACNMACKYCDADIYSHEKMSFKVLAHLIKKALNTHQNVHFIWHGGEPLLLGINFYQKAVWLQKKCLNSGQLVSNSIQTNGTLLDEKWLHFIDSCGFSIGLSIDGPAVLQNKHRVLQNQDGTFDKVMQAVSLLRCNKKEFGVLAVVTDDTIKFGAKNFFNFFVENGLKNFNLLCQQPAIIVGGTNRIQRSTHSQFLKEVFDLWYDLDDPDIHIRDFDSIMSALIGGQHTSCILAGGCIGKFFGVNTNGDIYHCDEFMADPRYIVGNVVNNNFEDIISGIQIDALKKENEDQIRLLDCKWVQICNGGCPKDRYVARMFAGREGKQIHCCGYADLIEHIQSRLLENPKVAELKILRQLS